MTLTKTSKKCLRVAISRSIGVSYYNLVEYFAWFFCYTPSICMYACINIFIFITSQYFCRFCAPCDFSKGTIFFKLHLAHKYI